MSDSLCPLQSGAYRMDSWTEQPWWQRWWLMRGPNSTLTTANLAHSAANNKEQHWLSSNAPSLEDTSSRSVAYQFLRSSLSPFQRVAWRVPPAWAAPETPFQSLLRFAGPKASVLSDSLKWIDITKEHSVHDPIPGCSPFLQIPLPHPGPFALKERWDSTGDLLSVSQTFRA